jgi:Putative zinc-finger
MSTHLRDDLLADAVDGRLSPADRHDVEAHLRTCSRCRDDVAAAGRARDALGSLPDELVPPVDVAAAVAAAGAAAGAPQRWYRAAALVAAAAAIALAVLVIPGLTRDGGSPETTAAVGAAPQEAGMSAADRSASPVPFAGVPSLEVVGIDFDHASLAALARQTGGVAAPTSGEATPQPTVAGPSGEAALACVRAGAAGAIPPDARVERLLAATFGGTPAYISIVARAPADDPAGIVVVAVATDGCRLLDSA